MQTIAFPVPDVWAAASPAGPRGCRLRCMTSTSDANKAGVVTAVQIVVLLRDHSMRIRERKTVEYSVADHNHERPRVVAPRYRDRWRAGHG